MAIETPPNDYRNARVVSQVALLPSASLQVEVRVHRSNRQSSGARRGAGLVTMQVRMQISAPIFPSECLLRYCRSLNFIYLTDDTQRLICACISTESQRSILFYLGRLDQYRANTPRSVAPSI